MTLPNKKVCKGCKEYEEFQEVPCSHITIEKGRYVPVKLMCPCSMCLIKMICITACPMLMDFQKITQFMTLLKCDDHKETINSWYGLKSRRHIDNFFEDIDIEGISDRIKELILIRNARRL